MLFSNSVLLCSRTRYWLPSTFLSHYLLHFVEMTIHWQSTNKHQCHWQGYEVWVKVHNTTLSYISEAVAVFCVFDVSSVHITNNATILSPCPMVDGTWLECRLMRYKHPHIYVCSIIWWKSTSIIWFYKMSFMSTKSQHYNRIHWLL